MIKTDTGARKWRLLVFGDFPSGLDADEILAVRENLQAAARLADGPPARRVPESMCDEIDQLLQILELLTRKQNEIGTS